MNDAGTNYWSFGVNTSGLLELFYYNGNSVYVTSTSQTMSTGTWYHICVQCNATNIYLYVNGVQSVTPTAISGTPVAPTLSLFRIGQFYNTAPSFYVGDVRIVYGATVYALTGFTPPYSLTTAPSGTTSLLVKTLSYYSSNAATITQWIQKTTSSYASAPGVQPFWANIATYNAISITWPSGSNKSYGCVLIPDGRVIFPPGDGGTYIGIFNPSTNTFSSISAASGYAGGVLVPDGRVVFVPENATNVGVFNPATGTFTTYASGAAGMTGSSSYWGGALASDGRVIFCPNNAQNVGTFNPATNSFTTYAYSGTAGVTIPGGSSAYWGGVLVPDGRIVFVPGGATNVGTFNPVTNSFTTYASGGPPGSNAHYGGVLAPDGRVIFTPSNTPNVGTFNPSSGTYTSYSTSSVLASPGYNLIGACLLPNGNVLFASRSSVAIYIFNTKTNIISSTNMIGTSNSTSACLLPDGRIVFSPQNDTTLAIISGSNRPVPREFCLHPFFNKY